MKKISSFLMIALVAIVALTACNNDPKPEPEPVSIVDNWMVDSSFVQIAALNMTEDLGLSGTLFTINADGTLIMTADGEAETFQYTIEDNTLNLYIENNGQTLVQPLTIATLTETTLVFTGQESQQGMTAELFIYLHRVNK